jgi:meso-butanediol dehydrogenase/(S,S)-butanediol dehydrogenase/diacetyl reductase
MTEPTLPTPFESPWGHGRPLDGKSALVTGAGRGIGRGVAEELAAAGAYVVAADIDLEGARQTIAGLGMPGEAHHLDVTDQASIDALFGSLNDSGRRVDILANVAGVLSLARVVDLSTEEWDRVMGVNARGTFLLSRAVLPGMIEAGGGSIVNISSAAGKEGTATGAHYSASKFAVIGFTQSLAMEVAEFGIRVNAVCPGVVLTPMIDHVAAEWKTTPQDMVSQWQLIKRPQEAREIGAAVVFLTVMPSMTGQSINVDGGSNFY